MFTGKQYMLTIDFRNLQMKPGFRVLDAGCGTGRHIREVFQSPGVDVVGIDRKWGDLCEVRNSLYSMTNDESGSCIAAKADVTNLPFKDSAFDIVICSEVLEHIPENEAAVRELVRVLKPGKDMVISVPSFLPERICWAISEDYHREPGGHIRIYKKKSLKNLLERAGTKCWKICHKHALHAPYWWLKCIVGHKNERSRLVNAYKKFLEWDIMTHPLWTHWLDKFLNPLMGKSIVFYLKKGC
jgi:ubiquinone/menaquinone biosynthesis C-methylase UbiE